MMLDENLHTHITGVMLTFVMLTLFHWFLAQAFVLNAIHHLLNFSRERWVGLMKSTPVFIWYVLLYSSMTACTVVKVIAALAQSK